MRELLLLSVAAMLLSACAMAPVYMQHATTGDVIKCGGNIAVGNAAAQNTYAKLRDCIDDFKEQGYKRLSDG